MNINYKKILKIAVNDILAEIQSDLITNFKHSKNNNIKEDISDLSQPIIDELLKRLKHTSYKGYKLIYQYEKDKGVLTISTIRSK